MYPPAGSEWRTAGSDKTRNIHKYALLLYWCVWSDMVKTVESGVGGRRQSVKLLYVHRLPEAGHGKIRVSSRDKFGFIIISMNEREHPADQSNILVPSLYRAHQCSGTYATVRGTAGALRYRKVFVCFRLPSVELLQRSPSGEEVGGGRKG